jgi:hypothetical protein
VFAACELWGWFDKQNLVGIIAFREGRTDQLCVLPSAQGRAIGTAPVSPLQPVGIPEQRQRVPVL